MSRGRRPADSAVDPVIGSNGATLREEPVHPCVDLVLNGLIKGTGEEFVFPPAAAEHLRTYLTELYAKPDYPEGLRSLSLFAFMLDRRGSPGAAQAILGVAEAVAKANKGK